MPVNFIYSFAFGIISGNSNVIKVSEKNFDQVNIFINCFNKISKRKKFRDAFDHLFLSGTKKKMS